MKWKAGIDIRQSGTGNVGAMNTYDVTRSRGLGVVILVLDLLKGMIAVCIPSMVCGPEFWTMATGGIGAVLGHNYSVWIRFRGGRGLATAAGAMVVLGWVFIAAWAAAWFVVNRFAHNVHVSNIVATAITPFVVLVIPMEHVPRFVSTSESNLFVLIAILCFLIILRHIKPILELRRSYTKSLS